MADWLHGHMMAVLIGIEILWVGGIVAIIAFYFLVRRRLLRDKHRTGATPAGGPSPTTDSATRPPETDDLTR